MSTPDLVSIQSWFAGRLPDGWFAGADVTIEDDQIVVLGKLADDALPSGEAERESFAAGRISRFREETRGQRIGIAREAEERFDKNVTWGAVLGGVTKRFTPGGSGRSQTGGRGRRGHHRATQTF